MTQPRFNQVFVLLLALSFVSAFLLPPESTNKLRGIQKLFSPIAWPSRKIASTIRNRYDKPESPDHRAAEDVKEENVELRAEVLNLTGQLNEMRSINNELEALGPLRPYCTRFHVNGNDVSPARESLILPATSFDGLEPQMPVIYPAGIVGRILNVTPGGSHVQLITDPKFAASGRFTRFDQGKPVYVNTDQPFITGIGRGQMQIANIPLRQTQGNGPGNASELVQLGDWVVLDDPAWPIALKSHVLGRVASIEKQIKAPTVALIRVKPMYELSALTDVMVMNRTGAKDEPRTGDAGRTAALKEP